MDKRLVRDYIKLMISLIMSWLYLPHLIIYIVNKNLRYKLNKDLERRASLVKYRMPKSIMLLYYIHNDRYFRNLFYHRVGPLIAILIGWWRPGDRYFVISKTTQIKPGAYFAHPFSSEINASFIGENFTCRHLTTLGNRYDGDNDNRPILGDNVTLGVNVSIIGNVTIGNNVTIGAGSVVITDIPDNCVAAGIPARVVKRI